MAFTAIPGSRSAMPGNVELGIADPLTFLVHNPEITLGPPMRGAPWFQRVRPVEAGLLRQAPQIPPRVGSETYAPEIHAGPPMRGAPWFKGFTVPPTPPRSPQVNPPNIKANKGFVPRVPDIEGQPGKDRLRRHTEIVQQILNSLIATGQLVQLGPASWEIILPGGGGGVLSFNARTGAVTLTAGDITLALGFNPVADTRRVSAGPGLAGGGPLSADIALALTPIGAGGSFTSANITLDIFGRVIAASSGAAGVTSPDSSLTVTGGTAVVINVGHTNVWTTIQEFQANIKANQGGLSPGFTIGDLTGNPIGVGAVDMQSQRSLASQAATATSALAIGSNCTSSGKYGVVIGTNSSVYNDFGIAIGSSSIAQLNSCCAIGAGATASGLASLAIGASAATLGIGATAFGNSAAGNGDFSAAFGVSAGAQAASSIAIGNTASAYQTNAIAIGRNSSALNANSIAIGFGTTSSADQSTAIGYGITNSTYQSAEIGWTDAAKINISAAGLLPVGITYLYTDATPFADTSKNIYLGAGLKDATPSFGTSGQVLGNVSGIPTWQDPTAAGIEALRAAADLTGQSAGVTVATFTDSGAGGTYRVGGYVTITAITAGTVILEITWKDETGTARTQTMFPQGLTSANLTATGIFTFPAVDIRVQASQVITLKTTFAGVSVAYDVGGEIGQLR